MYAHDLFHMCFNIIFYNKLVYNQIKTKYFFFVKIQILKDT